MKAASVCAKCKHIACSQKLRHDLHLPLHVTASQAVRTPSFGTPENPKSGLGDDPLSIVTQMYETSSQLVSPERSTLKLSPEN